jgi:hypothetical protein
MAISKLVTNYGPQLGLSMVLCYISKSVHQLCRYNVTQPTLGCYQHLLNTSKKRAKIHCVVNMLSYILLYFDNQVWAGSHYIYIIDGQTLRCNRAPLTDHADAVVSIVVVDGGR